MVNTNVDGKQLLEKLRYLVQKYWDAAYPPDIFTGESGDEGPKRVVEIRKVLDELNLGGPQEGIITRTNRPEPTKDWQKPHIKHDGGLQNVK